MAGNAEAVILREDMPPREKLPPRDRIGVLYATARKRVARSCSSPVPKPEMLIELFHRSAGNRRRSDGN